MARISRYPVLAHLRSEASSYVIRYRNGQPVRAGRGQAFFFRALNTAIAEVPLDDQELSFLFRGRSSDLQEVVAQGIITWRVTDPDVLATRIDFGIDVGSGLHLKTPIDQIGGRLTSLAQQYAWGAMATTPLRELVAFGVDTLRTRIEEGLMSDPTLPGMGLAIVSVRVSAVQPSAEVEKELAAPTRERIATEADEAVFTRRAMAVEKERAIAENELTSRIELARRTAQLVEEEGANERKRAAEAAASARIAAEGQAAVSTVNATARAESIRLVEAEKNAAEGERIGHFRNVAPQVLMGLAARELAGKVDTIEHLNLTPDLLSTLLADLVAAGTRKLEASAPER